jgi:hypothetical protein
MLAKTVTSKNGRKNIWDKECKDKELNILKLRFLKLNNKKMDL